MFLRCFTSSNPKEWVKWVALVKYCYNTSCHSFTKTISFELIYRRPSPNLLSYILGTTKVQAVEDALMQQDVILKELRGQLQAAQNQMKQIYDKNYVERQFE
uniref:Uncharacterized protein n=1 Tax=Rhizophora mucronata TaxID=61149 RepID=A0A2P2MIM2_RHIMU